ncbi:hypothetical protein KP509_04G047900 [Ceratopteris richardii]|uniref:Uncharacterized protein n=1 Tax=Ceratopteris richardii TaxID=49495 RepID=A0A8T2V4J1_CERRI|nr:hypothetical protein KP509_04G047900 [Ceratopteris richardii]KAH7439159.1 hypothetical protein KP509_04G047900 [Ceratopteris richardii]
MRVTVLERSAKKHLLHRRKEIWILNPKSQSRVDLLITSGIYAKLSPSSMKSEELQPLSDKKIAYFSTELSCDCNETNGKHKVLCKVFKEQQNLLSYHCRPLLT